MKIAIGYRCPYMSKQISNCFSLQNFNEFEYDLIKRLNQFDDEIRSCLEQGFMLEGFQYTDYYIFANLIKYKKTI